MRGNASIVSHNNTLPAPSSQRPARPRRVCVCVSIFLNYNFAVRVCVCFFARMCRPHGARDPSVQQACTPSRGHKHTETHTHMLTRSPLPSLVADVAARQCNCTLAFCTFARACVFFFCCVHARFIAALHAVATISARPPRPSADCVLHTPAHRRATSRCICLFIMCAPAILFHKVY